MSKHKKVDPIAADEQFFGQLAATTTEQSERNWTNEDSDGQLAVDVYQTKSAIVIRAAIAGVLADDIDISVNNDMVTIRGARHVEDNVPAGDYLYQECYWGGFSRTVILPVEVRSDKVTATLKNGILTVSLPMIEKNPAQPIRVEDVSED